MSESYSELSVVNVLRELEQLGWEYEFVGDEEVKCLCPAHADKTSSCSINVDKKLFKCHAAGCGQTGDFISFMAYATKGSRSAIVEYIRNQYEVDHIKIIDPSVIEKYHQKIWESGALKKQLYNRGLTDDAIRNYRLGVDDKNRISIPIKNKSGSIVNIRRYKPGSPSKEKMKNTRGMGKIRLYPISQLSYDEIVIAGGECKAIVIAENMNKHNIGGICCTGGEDNWNSEFSLEFKNKKVYICYDVDQQGIAGANKIAARIKTFASWVGVVNLPLDVEKYPNGDVNDYFGEENKTDSEFLELLRQVKEWEPERKQQDKIDNHKAINLPLFEITKAKHTRKRLKTKAVITAMDTTPYLVPRNVAVECDRNQAGCADCPVYGYDCKDDFAVLEISKTSSSIIELVDANKLIKNNAIREGLRIPKCKSCIFHVRSYYNVEDVRICPQLEISNRSDDNVVLPALTVSHGLKMNTAYELSGVSYPHPKTQQAVFLVGESVPCEDALDTYKPTNEEIEKLKIFQPEEWSVEGIGYKLEDIYQDLSYNVTRIFDRFNLHLFIDLVYHSPLLIPFDGRDEKGWTEILVVGDSAQGKSETTKRLMDHYGLGEKIEVKNASVAGLLGGLTQMGSRWLIQWGVIPRHDRRLVVLEELKGASTETIGRLTDMRSTGVAEIEKIEKRRTHARTRILALSNPRRDVPISGYSYGIEAARELIGGIEDLRRFDAVLIISASEIDSSNLNKLISDRKPVKHKYTSDLCKKCILWAWTRNEKEIEFSIGAKNAILDSSNFLCSKFVDATPILDKGSTRLKIGRLAASLSCRTASFSDDGSKLEVKECHVRYIERLLDSVYSSPVSGYKAFSEAYRSTMKLNHEDEIKRRMLATPFPFDFLEQMLHADSVQLRDISDWTGWDRGESTDLLSFLVRKHALIRDRKVYRKNPKFIDLMRELQNSDDLKKVSRPEHINERNSYHGQQF